MRSLQFVLDIGSSKIRLVASQKIKNYNKIISVIEKTYDGFSDSDFFDELALKYIISDLVNETNSRLGSKIKKIFIGVPSEFCICECKRISSSFFKQKKIRKYDIEELFAEVESTNSDNYNIINYSPMKFVLDNDLNVVNAIGYVTQTIAMDCSFVFAKKSFISIFDNILYDLGILKIEYICTALAQALLAVTKPQLQPIIVVDVGHITTSVAVLKGEGLLTLTSFSVGGGHITADLMQNLNFSYSDADLLKRKAILNIHSEKNERYEIKKTDKTITAIIQIVNNIIKNRIESIADVIDKTLSLIDYFDGLPVYLTGEGILNIKGARQIFSDALKRQVIPFIYDIGGKISKNQTAIYGLINLVSKLT